MSPNLLHPAFIWLSRGLLKKKAVTLLFLFSSFFLFGQGRADQVPTYSHLDNVQIADLNITFSGINTDALPISIDTDQQNFVYVLTFGNGIQRRNSDGTNPETIVPENQLNNAVDFVIDDFGNFYVADYSEDGSCAQNGKIKIFDSEGNFDRIIYTDFYRPLGLALDEDRNIYVAEYNQSGSGCEGDELSRISVYNQAGNRIDQTTSVSRPYRIAVNSDREVFVSQEGLGNPAVRIFDKDLNPSGQLSNIQSPGSVVIDAFDYIHVNEYAGRVDFSKFVNFDDISFNQAQDIAEDIDNGIDANAFSVKVFSPDNSYEYLYKEEIDFPVDIAFNSCDRMYINNGFVDGRNVFIVGYVPSTIEFDLEIYERSPSADLTPPVAVCISDPLVIELNPGQTKTITADQIGDGSYDLCGDVTLSIDKNTFSDANEGDNEVTLTVTDEEGNIAICEAIVHVDVDNSFSLDCISDVTVELTDDQPVTISASSLVNGNTSGLTFNPSNFQFDCSDIGNQNVTILATNSSGASDSCSVSVIVKDSSNPVITDCPTDNSVSIDEGETYTIPDYRSEISYSDNCDSSLTYTQSPAPNSEIDETTTVTIIVTDDAGLQDECSFEITVEKKEAFTIQCIENYTAELDYNSSVAQVATADLVQGDTSGIEFDINTQQFYCEDIGVKEITINATKTETGETSSCTLTVNIVDVGRPVIVCPADIQRREIPSSGVFKLPQVVGLNGIQDNCTLDEDLRIIQDPPVGTEYTEEGDYKITITAIDIYDNTETCEVTYQLYKAQEPDFDCPSPEDFSPVPLDENCEVNIPDYTETVTNFQNFESEPYVEQENETAGNVINVKLNVYEGEEGELVGQCQFSVDIIDELAPVLECRSSFTIILAEGETRTLTPEEVINSVTDNCDNIELSLDQENFTVEDEGFTDIIVTARDNYDNTVSCLVEVEVIVEDGETLIVNCFEEDILIMPNEECEYIVPDLKEYIEYSPDNAGFNQSIEAGTIISEGVNVEINVTYQGQEESCTVFISPEDQEAPAAICVGILEFQLSANEAVNITAEDIDNGSFDNCGNINLEIDKTEFTLENSGDNIVILTVTDDFGNTATCEAIVRIITENQVENNPPEAANDEYTTNINTLLSVSEGNGILSNDSDQDGDPLTAILKTDVSNGTLILDANGSFSYTPNDGFVGEDFFIYNASDGQETSNDSRVTINVVDTSGDFACKSQVMLVLNENGNAAVEVDDLYTGNGDGIEFTVERLVFSCEDLGENTVILNYSGVMEGSCEISVIVRDETAPVINARDLRIDLNSEGIAEVNFSDINAGSYDNCDEFPVYTLSKTLFTCKEVGVNNVNITATDASGNTSTAEVEIFVNAENGICADPVPGSEYVFIYPNPNSGNFKVATPSDVIIERIEMFDNRGRFITARIFDNTVTEYQMNVEGLQESMYVLKIYTNKGIEIKRSIFRR